VTCVPSPSWASILTAGPTAGRNDGRWLPGPLLRFAILKSARFRLVARAFAVLLLAWTTADLCGGFCMHDHEPITAGVPGGPGGARSLSGRDSHRPACTAGPDDCFCCSHYVHPQVRYQVVPAYTLVCAVVAPSVSRPRFPSSPLYHPPLL
jgi:hypothetical protein